MSVLTIALKITDFEFDQTMISEWLGLKPTAYYVKGDEYYVGPTSNRQRKIYEVNYWEYRISVKENSVWVMTILKQFVKEFVESKIEALETIKDKCQFEVYVGILYNKEERLDSFHFDLDLLKLFSRLNIELDIDQQVFAMQST